jgi:hypothetical protein
MTEKEFRDLERRIELRKKLKQWEQEMIQDKKETIAYSHLVTGSGSIGTGVSGNGTSFKTSGQFERSQIEFEP